MNQSKHLWSLIQAARKRYDWTAYHKHLLAYCEYQINIRKKNIDNQS